MLTFPSTVRIFVSNQYVDMRKSYDGLCGCVEAIIGADPLSGHLFVFFNRRATQVKILMWDRSGYCLYCKRLEKGRFNYKHVASDQPLSMPQLMLILEGIDLNGARQRKRFCIQ
jgi:transposase